MKNKKRKEADSDNARTSRQLRAAAIDEINQDYFVLNGGPNDGRIVSLKSQFRRPNLIAEADFKRRWRNKYIPVTGEDGKTKLKPYHTVWLDSHDRAEYTGLVFEPPGSTQPVPEGAYNWWPGFAVKAIRPKPGSAFDRFLMHLHDHVCGGDWSKYEFLLAWLADLVKQPGGKPGIALVLSGKQGAGKSIITNVLRQIFGDSALMVSKSDLVTGQFNQHLYGVVLLGLEEATWGGNTQDDGAMKDLITGDVITIHPKNFTPYKTSNHLHIIISTNSDYPVHASPDDRRFVVFDVADDVAEGQPGHTEFWEPIVDAYKDGTLASNLLWFLQQHEYDRKLLDSPIMTDAKAHLIDRGLPPHQEWLVEVAKGNINVALPKHPRSVDDLAESNGGIFGKTVYTTDVFDAFRKHYRDGGQRYFVRPTGAWRDWHKMLGTERRREPSGERRYVVDIPSWKQSRKRIAKWRGVPVATLFNG